MSDEFLYLLIDGKKDSLAADYWLAAGDYVLGRSSACQLVNTHATVSRRHARQAVDRKAIHVNDLGSRCGTFVNGIRIESSDLRVGDTVGFGEATYFVEAFSEERVAQRAGEADTDHPPESQWPQELEGRKGQVLRLLAQGLFEKAIGAKLGLSQHTVHDYVSALHKIFEVHSRGELLAKVYSQPWWPRFQGEDTGR